MSTALTPAELEAMRADLAALLPDEVSVRRRGVGGAWADVASYACRLTLGTGGPDERLSDAAHRVGASAVLRLPAGADVLRLDRVRVGEHAGEVRLVLAVTRAHLTALVALEGVPT